MMQIVAKKLGWFPVNWCRFSDNCASQFKCCYTVAGLLRANQTVMENPAAKVQHHTLEAHEAKNESDTVGGFGKAALRNVMLRDSSITIASAGDMVKVMERGLEKSVPVPVHPGGGVPRLQPGEAGRPAVKGHPGASQLRAARGGAADLPLDLHQVHSLHYV